MRKQGPISIVPFRIYNRDAFLEQNHPVIDPKDQAYDDYWFEVTNKVVYGMWKPDHPKGQPKKYRWIPGNLYFYINLTEIELQGDGNTAVYGPPSLRDIDWLKAYGFNACEGFSGFDGDEEITCNRLVDKYERGSKLRHDEELFLKADKTVLRPDGKYKKYVEAREYMYRTFDKPMGKPMWNNTALNFLELTSRGVGKSYWLANGQITYDYVTNGCKKVEDILDGKISTTLVIGSSQEKYTNDLLGKFNHTYEYLRIGPGYFNDGIDETFGFFYQPSEGSLNGKKPFTNRVLQQGGGGYLGAGSKIYNVTYYKNNQAGVGKRARKFITDESGTLDNFKAVHGENSAAQNRETKFGFSAYSGCVCAGTKVWTTYGELRNIEDLKSEDGILGFDGSGINKETISYWQSTTIKPCYRIITNTGRTLECSNDHPILRSRVNDFYAEREYFTTKGKWKGHRLNKVKDDRKVISTSRKLAYVETYLLNAGDQIAVIDRVPIFGNEKLFDSRFVGMLIGDGSYGFDKTPRFSNCDEELNNYVESRYECKIEKSYITKSNKLYKETRIKGICSLLREIGIYGQTKTNKRLPKDIHKYDENTVCDLLAGLYDTDGHIVVNKRNSTICITQSSFELINEIRYLLLKLGIHGSIYKHIEKNESRINKKISSKNPYYVLTIGDQESIIKFAQKIQLLCDHKIKKLSEAKIQSESRISSNTRIRKGVKCTKNETDKRKVDLEKIEGFRLEKIRTIEYIGEQEVYNLTANTTNTYLANGIITHNTGGNMDKIEGIKDAFSNPRGYEILPYEDLFGYNNKETGLFIPCYYRRDIYRDENGNIDLEKAYEDELAIRIEKGKESTEAYDAHIVSYPFYPHEMFMQVKQNAFPTILLEDRLAELEGGLWEKIAKVGKLEYVDNTKTRVRFDFDHLGKLKPIIHFKEEENRKNNKHGAVVIYEHPTPDKPEPSQMDPLYIAVYDPVRDDKGSSLCVVLVFKFWYPQDISKVQFNVVAEWIGRMDTLDENHEMAWKLASYYGCKMCPEINNADILRNARDTGRWQMLQKKPKKIMGEFQQLKDYEVGVYISPGMKPSLGLYLNEIFETVVDKQVEFLEDGTMKETIIKMASQIPSIRLIEEALNYGEGNFDMISAMFIVALVQRNNTLTIGTKETEKDEEVIQKYKEFVKKRNNFLNKKPVWAK